MWRAHCPDGNRPRLRLAFRSQAPHDSAMG